MSAPTEIVRRHEAHLVRCICPTCIRLDAKHRGEGHQLTFDQHNYAELDRYHAAKRTGQGALL